MIGVPAGTDAAGNTVGMAAATGVGAMNLVLPSTISTSSSSSSSYVSIKGAITSKIKHAIKLKTSPASCSPH